jgi:UDPglucose 6-dehydrogenase
MFNIGVVGAGFVGSAVIAGFSLKANIKVYDRYKKFDTLEDVCEQDIIFLCLPTPMRKSDGKPEMSFIYNVVEDIKNILKDKDVQRRKILVIKSTVLPGTNRKLAIKYPMFDFISNPEFLTARAARLDFINASRIIIGCFFTGAGKQVERLYREVFTHTPIYICSWEEAEMVKYMANCFFALKVIYLNEIYSICQKKGYDFELLKKMWLADGRIGNSHHEVPGHDGDRGFGGTCFPKDLSALIEWSKDEGVEIETLIAAQNVNNRIRKNKDWETYDGCN